jgi:formylglycine-generating enzyme required for sulfatase activity
LRTNPKDGLTYAWIPPGTFTMGCSTGDPDCFPDEKPAHPVTLTAGFFLSRTEVTVRAYKRFADIPDSAANGLNEDSGQMPAVDVTWAEAASYCKWAGGRLPTEAEWEYAARAGSSAPLPGDPDQTAWYEANSLGSSHPVGMKLANRFGLFDMSGNVWEWVNDWYAPAYDAQTAAIDPQGPPSGQMRVLRGGSWLNPRTLIRASDRARSDPEVRFNYFGFRCVWTPTPPQR